MRYAAEELHYTVVDTNPRPFPWGNLHYALASLDPHVSPTPAIFWTQFRIAITHSSTGAADQFESSHYRFVRYSRRKSLIVFDAACFEYCCMALIKFILTLICACIRYLRSLHSLVDRSHYLKSCREDVRACRKIDNSYKRAAFLLFHRALSSFPDMLRLIQIIWWVCGR